MKLHDRVLVEGTTPAISIGHREFRHRKSGRVVICKKWHAYWNHDGKKFDESLKTSNKVAAIRAAHRIVERLERGDVRQVQRRVEWVQMRDDYLSILRSKNRSPKTIEKYEYVTQCFIDFANGRKRPRPDSTTPADFWKFNEKMTEGGLHKKTRSDRLTIIKQWFKWAALKAKPRLLATNPIADEEVKDGESSPQPCFRPEQVKTLLANACHDHEAIIFAVMAYLGLRFGEVRDLEWSDFDFEQGENGVVNIRRGGSCDETKGKASRLIPVAPELRPFLDRLPREDTGRIFFQRPSTHYPHGDRPLSERRLLVSLKRLCKRCGFKNPEQYKLHTFRHAFASMLARRNTSYQQAKAWMGHKDSKILDLYITLFDADAEKAIKALNFMGTDTGTAA